MNRHVWILSIALASPMASSAELSDLERTIMAVESCRKEVPNFEESSRRAIDAWKRRNADAISAIQRDPESRQKIEGLIERESERLKSGDAHSRNMYSRICNGTVVQMIGGEMSIGGTSPLGTWNQFLTALKRGDADSVLSQMSDSMQSGWERSLAQLKAEGMQKFASGIVGDLQILEEGPESARAVVRLRSGRDAPVEFTRYGSRWFISRM